MPAEPSAHHHRVAAAFDGQAARFERAPVQSDPGALRSLVAAADFPDDSLVLDAGCGPGLVAQALLEAGHRVVGVDLSEAMIARARARCADFGDRSAFELRPLGTMDGAGRFDGAISRYVLHHVEDPAGFAADQVRLVRPGGILVLSDQTTDPDPRRAGPHQEVERLRDGSHTRNLAPGAIVDLLVAAGLHSIRLAEEPFTLDFDEWFDRGTPTAPKAEVRARIAALPPVRGLRVTAEVDGRLTMDCWRATARGVVAGRP